MFLDYLSTLAWLNPCILNVGLFSIPLEFVSNDLCRDLPSTPERDRTAERERSQLCRLDMTGTDERRNSCSRSGTPTRGGAPVPQPMFQPAVGIDGGHRHLPALYQILPLMGMIISG